MTETAVGQPGATKGPEIRIPKEPQIVPPKALVARVNEIFREVDISVPGIVPTRVTTQTETEMLINGSKYKVTILTAERQGIPVAQVVRTSRRIFGEGPESLTKYTLFTADNDRLKLGFDAGRLVSLSVIKHGHSYSRVELEPKWYTERASSSQLLEVAGKMGIRSLRPAPFNRNSQV